MEEERCASVEEERGAGVEEERGHRRGGAHKGREGGRVVEGGCGGGRAVEGRRGGGAGVDGCGEMTGLGFGGSCALKNKNSSDRR
jgi:hypothetical protein